MNLVVDTGALSATRGLCRHGTQHTLGLCGEVEEFSEKFPSSLALYPVGDRAPTLTG